MFSFVFSVLVFLFGKLQKKGFTNNSPRATKAYRNETRKQTSFKQKRHSKPLHAIQTRMSITAIFGPTGEAV